MSSMRLHSTSNYSKSLLYPSYIKESSVAPGSRVGVQKDEVGVIPKSYGWEPLLSSALCGYFIGFPSFPRIHGPAYTALYTCSGMKPLVFPKHDFTLKGCMYAHMYICTQMHKSVCTRTQTQHSGPVLLDQCRNTKSGQRFCKAQTMGWGTSVADEAADMIFLST